MTKNTARKNWSITGRLAFLYTLSALVTLVTVAVLIDWALRDSMSQEENNFVNDRLRVYSSIIKGRSDHLKVVRDDIEWEGAYVKLPEYYTRILNEQGETLVETTGMGRVLPGALFPPHPDEKRQNGDLQRHCANGRTYLLKTGELSQGFGTDGKRTVQIALDITKEQQAIAEKEKIILLLVVLGILSAAIVGILVARNALRPVKEIAGVAEQVTIAQIGMRTEPERWPKELRRLAVAFNGMLDRLEQSFVRLSQLSSDLAHELRTPVNNLLMGAEVTLSRDRSAEEYRATIESSVEEYLRLSRMIESLLFLARAENPAFQVARAFFDPMAEIEKMCSFFEAMAEEHGATVSCRGEGSLYGDHVMFSRAISNLLANALYYSPAGVRVDIAVVPSPDGALEVTVSDSGYGIPPDDLGKIFDRFYRCENTRAIHAGGSGLGLSIVKSVMDLHEGTIAIDSTLGVGTRITLHFPPPPPSAQL